MRFIGNVEKDAQVRAVASGALSSGDTVVVNSDGTVSVVSGASGSETVGTAVSYNAGNSQSASAAYDPDSGNIVIAFQDYTASGSGRAIVGSISGTSISFGTKVQYENGSSDFNSVAYDATNGKVVIAYRDNGDSNRPKAVVGTVSGTSISFGSPVTISSNTANQVAGAVYDASTGKVVVVWSDQGNSGYGTAAAGTVSGTSISFGANLVFNSANTPLAISSLAYDPTEQRVIVPYKDDGNSGRGTAVALTGSGTTLSSGTPAVYDAAAISNDGLTVTYDSGNEKIVITYLTAAADVLHAVVGTVSGTSISFGTAVATSFTSQWVAAAYDSLAQKVIIHFRDRSNSDYGTVSPFSVSGTTGTFDTATVYLSASTQHLGAAYDSVNQKTALVYSNGFTSGDVSVYASAFNTTNLTAENFLGFAAHTYADTQSALVNSTCTVDRNQSGLTAGQKYYVQTDGTLGTTAADPSVEAGTAISSTEIIVKG